MTRKMSFQNHKMDGSSSPPACNCEGTCSCGGSGGGSGNEGDGSVSQIEQLLSREGESPGSADPGAVVTDGSGSTPTPSTEQEAEELLVALHKSFSEAERELLGEPLATDEEWAEFVGEEPGAEDIGEVIHFRTAKLVEALREAESPVSAREFIDRVLADAFSEDAPEATSNAAAVDVEMDTPATALASNSKDRGSSARTPLAAMAEEKRANDPLGGKVAFGGQPLATENERERVTDPLGGETLHGVFATLNAREEAASSGDETADGSPRGPLTAISADSSESDGSSPSAESVPPKQKGRTTPGMGANFLGDFSADSGESSSADDDGYTPVTALAGATDEESDEDE